MKISTIAAVLVLADGGARAATLPVRTEIPVREVDLSNGMRRYVVPIAIGASQLDAGLDTGSTGLRVLPGVLAETDAQPSSRTDSYYYDSGAKLDGVIAKAMVAVSELEGFTTFQLVRQVGCTTEQPRCVAGAVPLAQYGIQGDGLPGEGFKAILGVSMATADVANPFTSIGARRWIVDLPRPGERDPGRVVLNPADNETSDYISLPVLTRFSSDRGGRHDAVAGCLINEATAVKICGAVMLDTGAPGIRVVTPGVLGAAWPEGTSAILVFAGAAGKVKAAERLTIGMRAQASHLTFERRLEAPMPMIYTGLIPYLAFSILYDTDRGQVALKPRPPYPGGPVAISP